jgi:hypothetical protein
MLSNFPLNTLVQPTEVTTVLKTVKKFDEPLTDETYPWAEDALVVCKTLLAKGKKIYKRMLDPLNEQRRTILDWRADELNGVQENIDRLTHLITTYQLAKEIEQEEAATKALAEAKVAAEKIKANQIAELESLATELEAVSPEHVSDTKKQVEELKNAPAPMVAVLPDSLDEFSEQDSKLSSRDDISVEVMDMVLLAQAVAKHELPPEVLKPNLVELKKAAKTSTGTLPGCQIIIRRSFRRKVTV